jgi:DNA replication protein DnaC
MAMKQLWELTEAELRSGILTVKQCKTCGGTGRREVAKYGEEFEETCDCRVAVDTAFEGAGFPERRYDGKTLAIIPGDKEHSFDWTRLPQEQVDAIRERATYCRSFVKRGMGALLAGEVGTGKTHVAVALGKIACGYGFWVSFVSVAKFIAQLKQALGRSEDVSRCLQDLYECDLLILDDLGKELDSPFSREQLYQIAEHRFVGNRATIITSNDKYEGLNERYVRGTMSRFLGDGTTITFVGDDYRLKVERERKYKAAMADGPEFVEV